MWFIITSNQIELRILLRYFNDNTFDFCVILLNPLIIFGVTCYSSKNHLHWNCYRMRLITDTFFLISANISILLIKMLLIYFFTTIQNIWLIFYHQSFLNFGWLKLTDDWRTRYEKEVTITILSCNSICHVNA